MCRGRCFFGRINERGRGFFTGTAAVIAPVGRIVYKNNETRLKISFEESMTRKIRERLIDIQYENIEDPFGWVIPLGR